MQFHYRYLLVGLFIDYNAPDPDIEVDEDLILPEGPPQDPHQPLLADEDVFTNHHRHSDFGMATLVRDTSSVGTNMLKKKSLKTRRSIPLLL